MKRRNKGITLIALIITIIVMLLLVAVSVQIAINSGLFDSAKTAAKKTEEEYRAEGAEGSKVNIDGEIYNSMEEYMEKGCTHEWEEEVIKAATCTETGIKEIRCKKCGKGREEEIPIDETSHNYKNYICTICGAEDPNKPIEAGQYIKYDVTYTDIFKGYNYTETNGWRLLHATPNGDGTYRNVELISTGIPAKFYYSCSDEGNWWITDTSKLITFKNLLGGSKYNTNISYSSLKAAAGFYYNFGNLSFTVTNGPNVNNGGYTAITNKNRKTGTTVGTGAALFLTSKASGVRLLTLKEINEARRITNDPDNTEGITAAQDPTGIYRLQELKNVPGIGAIDYSTSLECWIASPFRGSSNPLVAIGYMGNVDYNSENPFGVRPVVKISRG